MAYETIDYELTVCVPILGDKADLGKLTNYLEKDGPFFLAFSIDMKEVWALLFAMFGHNPCWQHVKKYQNQQTDAGLG